MKKSSDSCLRTFFKGKEYSRFAGSGCNKQADNQKQP